MGNRLKPKNMIVSGNNGVSLPPKPLTAPNRELTPILKSLVKVETEARFRTRARNNIQRSQVPQKTQKTVPIPLEMEKGNISSKNALPEDQKITRAQLVGRNVNMLATQELQNKVAEVYGKRPNKNELRKLMKNDPSLGHYYRKTKRQLNNKFDPTGEFEDFRYYQGDTE